MTDKVVSLAAVISARRSREGGPVYRIFRCIACSSYSFKVLEIDGASSLVCANCETWVNEFDVIANREID